MHSFTFSTAKTIVFGAGSIAQIGNIALSHLGKRVILVTDRGIVDAKLHEGALASLAAAGVAVTVFDGVTADPPEAVVLAAAGYPDSPRKGDRIDGLPQTADDDTHVFHAGTAEQDGAVVTAGGRVLCVTALGDNVRAAQKRAYELAESIVFDGRQFRRDIGHRALNRKS